MALLLRRKGIANVRPLAGGLEAWRRHVATDGQNEAATDAPAATTRRAISNGQGATNSAPEGAQDTPPANSPPGSAVELDKEETRHGFQ